MNKRSSEAAAVSASLHTQGEETAFQRLYDDGLLRVQRLEKLREKVRKERSRLGFMDKAEAGFNAALHKS